MAKTIWIGSVILSLLCASTVAEAGQRALTQLQTTGDSDQPASAEVQEQAEDGSAVIRFVPVESSLGRNIVFLSGTAAQPVAAPRYFLGIQLVPATPALRAQLGLAEDQGLVVQSIIDGSPAAEAGFEQHDVISSAQGKPMATAQDMIDTIQESGGKELSIELIRGGKPVTLAVTPVVESDTIRVMPATDATRDALRRALELLQRPDQSQESIQWHVLPPGSANMQAPRHSPNLPENMSVTITKQGDKPAKISVKQDDDSWEVTEDEMDKLPDEIRPYVELMLGQGPIVGPDGVLRMNILPNLTAPILPNPGPVARVLVQPTVPSETVPDAPDTDSGSVARMEVLPPSSPDSAINNRLEQIEQRIDQLRESIDQLRQDRRRIRSIPESEVPDNS